MKSKFSLVRSIFCLVNLLLISFLLQAQNIPAYNPAKGFFDYQRRMNAYYDQVGKAKAGYKQWKRLEWYFSTRSGLNGELLNLQELKQEALLKTISNKYPSGNDSIQPQVLSGAWSQVGPLNINTRDEGIGRVNRLAFHPTSENTLYAATAGGGLWKTINGGTSWQPLTDGLPNLNVSDVAVNPQNPNIIYIITGDADGGGEGNYSYGKNSTGVLKSVDGGITWTITGLKWKETDGMIGYKLLMHPSDFDILLVAAKDGIYYTDDAAKTWSKVLSTNYVYDIEFMPNNPLVAYAGASGGLFYKSTNSGVSWTLKYDNPNPLADRVGIAVTPDNSSEVFMMIGNMNDVNQVDSSYTFNGIYYSDSTGETGSWVRRASGLPNVFIGDGSKLIGRQQRYDHSLAVSPLDSKKLVAGGISIWRSDDSGSNLIYINPDVQNYHVDIHELVYAPSGNILYAATDGGVYKSLNNGNTWVSLNNNFPITQYYRISVSNSSSIEILGGSQDNGTHFRNSSSSTFELAFGADGTDNAISKSHPAFMYVSRDDGTFLRSTTGGFPFQTFCSESILESQGILVKGPFVTPIDVSANNPNLIYLGYNSLIKGVFSGLSWTFFNVGLNWSDTVSGEDLVKIAPSNSNCVYAGDSYYGTSHSKIIWRTINGGNNWNPITIPYDLERFSNLCINPNDQDEIWLTYGGFSDGYKVFYSADGGASWDNVSGSLPNVPVNCVIYANDDSRTGDALYIGTDIGVFYRDNTLGDWIPYSTGLPVAEVTDLEISEASGLLRAGTYGRGIWQTSLYSASCPSNANFITNSHPPSTPAFVSVTNSITSIAIIEGAGAHIQYKAGVGVTLNPGFRIDGSNGAKFVAYTGPCPGGGIPPAYYTAPTMNGLSGYLLENK